MPWLVAWSQEGVARLTERHQPGGGNSRGLPGLGFLGAHAFTVELQDCRVMHEPINCRHGGHRVLEDLIPFREHQVAGDHHAAPLLAFGQEREQHFHFLPNGAGNKIATAEHQSRRKSLWRKLVQSDGGAELYQKAFGKRQNRLIHKGESSRHLFRVQNYRESGDFLADQCPNLSTLLARPFHTTSNCPNRFMISRHPVANANIRWLLDYFFMITLFTTSRFLTIIESVSTTSDNVFKSMTFASSQATASSKASFNELNSASLLVP